MNDVELTICKNLDSHGESSCEFAKFSPNINRFVCSCKCVCELYKELENERSKRFAVERKLVAYKNAITPFIGICRECVKIAEYMDKEMSK